MLKWSSRCAHLTDPPCFIVAAVSLSTTLKRLYSSLPQERFVIQVTDLLTVSMMLGITAQVKEAGIAWDKGEKKSERCLSSKAGCDQPR